MKLTEAQRRALTLLADRGDQGASPAEVGYAITEDREWPLKPQGAGRIGGTMGWRLIKANLALHRSINWPGRGRCSHGYTITMAGRQALADAQEGRRG